MKKRSQNLLGALMRKQRRPAVLPRDFALAGLEVRSKSSKGES